MTWSSGSRSAIPALPTPGSAIHDLAPDRSDREAAPPDLTSPPGIRATFSSWLVGFQGLTRRCSLGPSLLRRAIVGGTLGQLSTRAGTTDCPGMAAHPFVCRGSPSSVVL